MRVSSLAIPVLMIAALPGVAQQHRRDPLTDLEIDKIRDAAQELTLCIGGDEGLASRVREEARFVWSLSPLTLPHRLARVIVLEQLYRAFEILRGAPYHK